MTDALKHIRVLDLTNVLAGPFCCHQLAHMGADVIKVEKPGQGDLARQLGADPQLNTRQMGVSFLAQNAGKRSITLDLKQPEGKQVLRELVRTADVLVENFRPGVMTRLGLGYEQLKLENPQLIYCAISGYGADGPMQHMPAYDQIIQGVAGVMSITGTDDSAPLRVGYPLADTVGGLTAAFAISSALAGRGEQGDGCFIDVSMLESVLATMGWVVSNHLIADIEPKPMGNNNVTASPSGTFKTGDGLLNLAANRQRQFEVLCDQLSLETLKTDARFATRQARLENREALTTLLEQALSTRSATQWAKQLNVAGVPAGPVLTVPQALQLPQIKQRDLHTRFTDIPEHGRDISIVRTGFQVDGVRPAVASPPPALGEHTAQILTELGYSTLQQQQLRERAVL